MKRSQERDNLRDAIGTRGLIGQAQGILMERFRVTEDRAFPILVHASQTTNTKLIDVVRDLTSSGQLATTRTRRDK